MKFGHLVEVGQEVVQLRVWESLSIHPISDDHLYITVMTLETKMTSMISHVLMEASGLLNKISFASSIGRDIRNFCISKKYTTQGWRETVCP